MNCLEKSLYRTECILGLFNILPYIPTVVFSSLFFKFPTGADKCRSVLAKMVKNNYVNRYYDHFLNSYVYFQKGKKPIKQATHQACFAFIYVGIISLPTWFHLIHFKVQPHEDFEDFTPDIWVKLHHLEKGEINLFFEVQFFNSKGSKLKYKNIKWYDYFPVDQELKIIYFDKRLKQSLLNFMIKPQEVLKA